MDRQQALLPTLGMTRSSELSSLATCLSVLGSHSVSPPQVALANGGAREVEQLLEIPAGKGEYAREFSTSPSNLYFLQEGLLTSGSAIQMRVIEPVPVKLP